MKKLLLILPCLLLLAGCSITISSDSDEDTGASIQIENPSVNEEAEGLADEDSEESSDTDSATITKINLEESRSIDGEEVCQATLTYPEVSLENEAVADKINNTIQRTVAGVFRLNSTTPEEAFDEYLTSCLVTTREVMGDESYYLPYFKTLETTTTLNQDSLLSIHFYLTGYSGGVHPGHIGFATTFDLETGELLNLEDLLAADQLENFYRFEKERLVEEYEDMLFDPDSLVGDELSSEDYLQNYYLTPEGLQSLYQEYEVAPYAVGPLQLLILYTDLKPFLDENSPLNRFIQ